MGKDIIMATLGGYPAKNEMLLWIGDAIATGRIDPVADLAGLTDKEVRRLFTVAYTAVMGEGEAPPATIRADLFEMAKARRWHN